MFQQLHQPIKVFVEFEPKGLIKPRYFYLNGYCYHINKIELFYKKREGENVIYYLEVTDNANYFKLAFDSLNLKWYLEALQNE